jgi:hypothetical protein
VVRSFPADRATALLIARSKDTVADALIVHRRNTAWLDLNMEHLKERKKEALRAIAA